MNALTTIHDELFATLSAVDNRALETLRTAFADRSRRWWVSGQGRSRLVGSMIAMRLMHVGFEVHMTGEVTAPSIGVGDSLLMLSASGETPVSVHLARRAAEAGAQVLAVSTHDDSSLAALAYAVVVIPAHDSKQFGGSLFEQASLLLLDAMILAITRDDPDAYATMSQRHTNLE